MGVVTFSPLRQISQFLKETYLGDWKHLIHCEGENQTVLIKRNGLSLITVEDRLLRMWTIVQILS